MKIKKTIFKKDITGSIKGYIDRYMNQDKFEIIGESNGNYLLAVGKNNGWNLKSKNLPKNNPLYEKAVELQNETGFWWVSKDCIHNNNIIEEKILEPGDIITEYKYGGRDFPWKIVSLRAGSLRVKDSSGYIFDIISDCIIKCEPAPSIEKEPKLQPDDMTNCPFDISIGDEIYIDSEWKKVEYIRKRGLCWYAGFKADQLYYTPQRCQEWEIPKFDFPVYDRILTSQTWIRKKSDAIKPITPEEFDNLKVGDKVVYRKDHPAPDIRGLPGVIESISNNVVYVKTEKELFSTTWSNKDKPCDFNLLESKPSLENIDKDIMKYKFKSKQELVDKISEVIAQENNNIVFYGPYVRNLIAGRDIDEITLFDKKSRDVNDYNKLLSTIVDDSLLKISETSIISTAGNLIERKLSIQTDEGTVNIKTYCNDTKQFNVPVYLSTDVDSLYLTINNDGLKEIDTFWGYLLSKNEREKIIKQTIDNIRNKVYIPIACDGYPLKALGFKNKNETLIITKQITSYDEFNNLKVGDEVLFKDDSPYKLLRNLKGVIQQTRGGYALVKIPSSGGLQEVRWSDTVPLCFDLIVPNKSKKKENKMKLEEAMGKDYPVPEKKSMKSMIRKDLENLAYRQGAEKVTMGVKASFQLILSQLFKLNKEQMKTINYMLEQPAGEAALALAIGYGLHLIPAVSNNEIADKLAENFRAQGWHQGTNAGFDKVISIGNAKLIPFIQNVAASIKMAQSGDIMGAAAALKEIEVPDNLRINTEDDTPSLAEELQEAEEKELEFNQIATCV